MLATVRVAGDSQDFWQEPTGSCIAGRRYVFFCATRDLWGYRIWGDLDESDVVSLRDMVASELVHHVPLHASYIDIRGVKSIHESFYPVALAFIGEHGTRLSSLIRSMAVLRPRGLVGAIAEGIPTQLSFPHPFKSVAQPEEALRFLGVEAPTLPEDLDAIQAQLEATPPLLQRVRSLLEASPGRLPLGVAAKAVGLSPRTLQRNLSELGTTFQHEVNRAQVGCAQKLLRGDAKLSTIAIEVGCPSLQHFSTLFRRMTGQTPSAWRKERRDA
jgi:AraC-like DNA-binding protein